MDGEKNEVGEPTETEPVETGTVVEGIHCELSDASFHENGKLKRVKPAKDSERGGVFYAKDKWLNFWENGDVSQGVLAKDTERGGRLYESGYRIWFSRSGGVLEGKLKNKGEVKTK